MKKSFVPSKRILVVFVFIVLVIPFLLSTVPSFLHDSFLLLRTSNFSGTVKVIMCTILAVQFLPIYLVICLFLLYCGSLFFLFACRPVRFCGRDIYSGYIMKRKYRQENITGIGIAPVIDGLLLKPESSKFQGIYIAFGSYRKSDITEYGILNVWEVTEFRKVFPKVVHLMNRIVNSNILKKHGHRELDLTKIQDFDGLLWMSYSEERLSFLKAWLGSRFYELTQTE